MYLKLNLLLKSFLLIMLSAVFTISHAQDYQKIQFRIDSLANVGLPKLALAQVAQLDKQARLHNNAAMQVRAVIYRITFQSYIQEDAIISIIDTLNHDIARSVFPVKPVLQSLLAQMYWQYYEQNRYQFGQRSRLEKPDADFRKWDLQTIVDETSRLYKQSLSNADNLQQTPVGVLDGVLAGYSTTRYLRPTLYDLLLHRALDFFLADEPAITKPKMAFRLNDVSFYRGADSFVKYAFSTADTNSTYYQGVKLLQQATLFHLSKGDRDALADLDIKRIVFLHNNTTLPKKDSLYLNSLRQIATNFNNKPISTDALVLEAQFYQQQDSLMLAYQISKQAAAKYPKSIGGKNAVEIIKGIEAERLSATVEDRNMPGRPILARLSYTNVKHAHIAIYKIPAEQFGLFDNNYGSVSTDVSKVLAGLTPVQDIRLVLSGTGDYRAHSTEFKIDPLPIGDYAICINKTGDKDKSDIKLATFVVGHLAYFARGNPDGTTEIRVVDRETGAPMDGVKVSVGDYLEKPTGRVFVVIKNGFTDSEGKFLFVRSKDITFFLSLSKNSESIIKEVVSTYGTVKTDETERPENRDIIFTDRQLYRPGQTIYFKALRFQKSHGISSVIPNAQTDIGLRDVNNKTISTISLTTNEFGSVAGSFIIPQNMLNGGVSLITSFGRISVRVEEYKRPTFQVKFLPATANFRPNDSVSVKGNVIALSGYGLSNVKVACHITRSLSSFQVTAVRQHLNTELGKATEIFDDTLTTNYQGEFIVKFKAETTGEDIKGIKYSYNIQTDVTDASGETQTAGTNISVGDQPLFIMADLPDKLTTPDHGVATIKLININNQLQNGTANVKIFTLLGPGRVFKDKLWNESDQFVLSAKDFEKYFPDYAYKNEGDYNAWPSVTKIADYGIKIKADSLSALNLEMLTTRPSGMYRVVIAAQDADGDTISTTQYINVINEPALPQKMDDWIVPLATSVQPGGQAEFLVGTGKPCKILMEYQDSKGISSRWLSLDSGVQKLVKVDVSDASKNNHSVQFAMINDNRRYFSYYKINIIKPDKKLNIKFLTYRDKLQPGEKEQWKIQIGGTETEKNMVEMLAGLYDASLDDIVPGASWNYQLEHEPYHPDYYRWEDKSFVSAQETGEYESYIFRGARFEREYEYLNLFDYNYFGQYNYLYRAYLDQIKANKKAAKNDQIIEARYKSNATKVKSGIVVSGRVVFGRSENGVAGVKISIKNINISTLSNSLGYFKIKVPINGLLFFRLANYVSQSLQIKNGNNLIIHLRSKESVRAERELMTADPGVKSQEGDPNAQIRIDEPVGAADVYSVVEVDDYAAAPPVVRSDNELHNKGKDELLKNLSGYVDFGKLSPNKILNIKANKPITIRKNFSETAFFYPQLHTNEKGEILIDFTIPEALTRWKFKAFAHTKHLKSGYLESEVVTQKKLSITANMPRFFREGDTITISARLANLTAESLKGETRLQLFNSLNMQPVKLLANAKDSLQIFEVAASSNKAIAFKMIIPAGLDAITYRLTAASGNYADGEENTYPVLPNRMLVTESMPMMVRAGQTKAFTFDKLVNPKSTTLQNKSLTLEYTQNPAWYAVQALPYLMEFPYECSEQIFSRYYANSMASSLVNRMPEIKQVFDRWRATDSKALLSDLEKNQELKQALIEETPWLRDAESEGEQKKRIALLFDLNKMGNELSLNLDKLLKKQLPDGGFPWFGGDRSDRYITQHIAAGIGELSALKAVDINDPNIAAIKRNTLKYIGNQLIADDNEVRKIDKNYRTRDIGSTEIHAWYVNSYFTNEKLSPELQTIHDDYLKRAEKYWTSKNVYEQAMIALTMLRNNKAQAANIIIRSLKETAQQSDDQGMYWAKNILGYYWYQSPIETQCLLIELFTEAGNNDKAVEEMKIWLLRNKQTSNWKTTKATAAACYALLLKGDNWLAANANTSTIKLNGTELTTLKPDTKAEAGTGYIKTTWADEQVKPSLGTVEINNNGKTMSWGAVHWQYLEQLDKITPSQTDIHLERKYFIQKQTDAGAVLTAVDATHQPKTGDLLKVVVYLKAGRDFEYVQLKDMRPAGTEPVDALSTYKYQDGLYYYQVTKDVATNFFISNLSKGNYVFEYRLRVAQPGNFATGITTVQSMYAPEFNAHSEGARLTVNP